MVSHIWNWKWRSPRWFVEGWQRAVPSVTDVGGELSDVLKNVNCRSVTHDWPNNRSATNSTFMKLVIFRFLLTLSDTSLCFMIYYWGHSLVVVHWSVQYIEKGLWSAHVCLLQVTQFSSTLLQTATSVIIVIHSMNISLTASNKTGQVT